MIGTDIITPNAIHQLSDERLAAAGIAPQVIQTIRAVPLDCRFEGLSEIPRVGIWTIKAVMIMTYQNPDVFLAEDAYVRSRLATIYRKESITMHEAEIIGQKWIGYRSLVSRFLWRLTDQGANKIAAGNPISSDDII